jgi:hypothetical protein
MKCEIKKAKEYQAGFNSGLDFTGFEDGEIQWIGTRQEFQQARRITKEILQRQIEEQI